MSGQRRVHGLFAVLLAALALYSAGAAAAPRPGQSGPATVRVVEVDGRYQLRVDGQPLFVRGAGLEHGDYATLAARGGNALRTWRVGGPRESGRQVLDRARDHGLFVAMGLDVGRERHGFDYADPRAVARQLARLRKQVIAHREHPALLLWVVGNELNLDARNPQVWDAVNDIVAMIREVDPRHPALTPLAGFDAATLAEIRRRAPQVELLGVQLYGDIARLGTLREAGWDGPYLVTEWGPTGHWEVAKTPWGAPIEDSSQAKAERLVQRYRTHILGDPTHALGSFVFLWGHKQERTPTWYGMFLDSGEYTAAVDAMQTLWTGEAPAHPAPAVGALWLDGRRAEDGVVLPAGQPVRAFVEVDPEGASDWAFDWVLREESRATSIGGDPEKPPRMLRTRFDAGSGGEVRFTTPRRAGAYRLFVSVRDRHGGAGHANLPFRVARR